MKKIHLFIILSFMFTSIHSVSNKNWAMSTVLSLQPEDHSNWGEDPLESNLDDGFASFIKNKDETCVIRVYKQTMECESPKDIYESFRSAYGKMANCSIKLIEETPDSIIYQMGGRMGDIKYLNITKAELQKNEEIYFAEYLIRGRSVKKGEQKDKIERLKRLKFIK